MNDPAPDRDIANVWFAIRRRKVVQWGVASAAAALVLLQVLDYFSGTFDWPRQIQQLTTVALLIGLPVALILACYHGDRGHQRHTTPELGMLAVALLLGGAIETHLQYTRMVA